jgi:DinB superfamily
MEDVIEDFRRTVEDAARRMLAISEEESRAPRAENKWSPKEIVGHLIDSASNNHQRFVRAQFTDHLVFPGYEQESWVRAQGYGDEPWPLLVELWRSFNLHLAHVMARSPEAARLASRERHNLDEIGWIKIGEGKPATLEYLMRDYIGHLKNHLRQILGGE